LLLAGYEYKYLITNSPSKRITPRKRNFITVIKPHVFSSDMSTVKRCLDAKGLFTGFRIPRDLSN
jgi:hypothetical protein